MIREIRITDSVGKSGSRYGLCIETENGIFGYEEISECRDAVEKLARRLKDGDVSPVHFNDIVRDFIVELTYEKLSANNLL